MRFFSIFQNARAYHNFLVVLVFLPYTSVYLARFVVVFTAIPRASSMSVCTCIRYVLRPTHLCPYHASCHRVSLYRHLVIHHQRTRADKRIVDVELWREEERRRPRRSSVVGARNEPDTYAARIYCCSTNSDAKTPTNRTYLLAHYSNRSKSSFTMSAC